MSLSGVDAYLRGVAGSGAGVAGAVLLVRQGGQRVFHEAYGYARIDPQRARMRPDTLFDLASLTKPVCTALLAMSLWQEGALDLDRRVSFWFPAAADPAKEAISVRHLLSHRSGLAAWRPFHAGVAAQACPVPAEEVRRRVLDEPLVAEPGTREIYSDLGFMLMGWLLERQGGKDLGGLFMERIARPLGLRLAGFRRIGVEQAGWSPGAEESVAAATERCPWRGRVLEGEVHDENCYLLGGVAGHAGLFAAAEDLDRVAQEIFRGWRGGSDLFSCKGLRAFLLRESSRAPAGTWALGWDTPSRVGSTSGRFFSEESCGHTGFTGTSIWIDLARSICVILLTNRVHPSRENTAIRTVRPRVHDLVMEELLGLGTPLPRRGSAEGR